MINSQKISEEIFENFFDNQENKENSIELTKDEELDVYRKMLLIRRFEEKAAHLYSMGLIGGFCHLYIGQEAVVVGTSKVMQPGDQSITSYRDHGHMLVTGINPKFIMAELTGRKNGFSKGKGGSMHMFSLKDGFYGGHGIVGAQVPIGTGLAFANHYRENNCVTLTYFGDGAINQGQVYESFNMASLWKLPIIYIVENNQYAMGTSICRASSSINFSRKGLSFRIPGIEVDGMDVYSVIRATNRAISWARSGKGPVILDIQTYRYRGHSMSDPAKYRTREEVQKIKNENDAINNLKYHLSQKNLANEKDLEEIDKDICMIVNDAADFAQSDSEPDISDLYKDILA